MDSAIANAVIHEQRKAPRIALRGDGRAKDGMCYLGGDLLGSARYSVRCIGTYRAVAAHRLPVFDGPAGALHAPQSRR